MKLRGLDYVTCKMCQWAILLKDIIIIRNVFGSYGHFVKIVEHLNNAINRHAIMFDEEKNFILDMAPKWPHTMADIVITKCVRNR